jgi:hypothetical protein
MIFLPGVTFGSHWKFRQNTEGHVYGGGADEESVGSVEGTVRVSTTIYTRGVPLS